MRRSFLAWVGVIAGFLVGATSGWLAHQRRAEHDVASAVASEEFLARMFDASFCGIVLQVVDRGRLDLVNALLNRPGGEFGLGTGVAQARRAAHRDPVPLGQRLHR